MWVFPLAATVVAVIFAALLGRQYLERRRPFQLLWSIAMLMYAAASFALFLGVLSGWTASMFRVYWLFGAVLTVPYLAMGEVYLLIKNRIVVNALLFVLLFATAFAVARVKTSPVEVARLAKQLPLGKDVFGDGTAPYRLSQIYDYPTYLFLVAGSIWSAWRMRGRPELRDRAIGTIGIAVGATIVAIGSGVGAGLNVVPVFTIGLTAGIAVMFWVFLRASRVGSPAAASAGANPAPGERAGEPNLPSD